MVSNFIIYINQNLNQKQQIVISIIIIITCIILIKLDKLIDKKTIDKK